MAAGVCANFCSFLLLSAPFCSFPWLSGSVGAPEDARGWNSRVGTGLMQSGDDSPALALRGGSACWVGVTLALFRAPSLRAALPFGPVLPRAVPFSASASPLCTHPGLPEPQREQLVRSRSSQEKRQIPPMARLLLSPLLLAGRWWLGCSLLPCQDLGLCLRRCCLNPEEAR